MCGGLYQTNLLLNGEQEAGDSGEQHGTLRAQGSGEILPPYIALSDHEQMDQDSAFHAAPFLLPFTGFNGIVLSYLSFGRLSHRDVNSIQADTVQCWVLGPRTL